MRVTPIVPDPAVEPEAAAAPAATPEKGAAPAAAGSGRRTAGEILRASAAKAADASRNRGSAPEGSEAGESEEPERGAAASTTTDEKAEGHEEEKAEDGKPSKSVRRRLRVAKRAAEETSSEVAALKAQVEMLAGLVAGKVQNGAPAAAKPKAFEPPKFSEAFPEDGTTEQQESWRLRKAVHETALPLAEAMAKGIVSDQLQKYTELLSPVLDDYVTKARSTQIERARPQIEELGWDMDEVLEAARGIVGKNPNLPMEAAIGLVIFGGQEEAVPAQKEEGKKIPSRAGKVVDTLSRRAAADRQQGVFGNSWRSRHSELAQILKDRAARKKP